MREDTSGSVGREALPGKWDLNCILKTRWRGKGDVGAGRIGRSVRNLTCQERDVPGMEGRPER